MFLWLCLASTEAPDLLQGARNSRASSRAHRAFFVLESRHLERYRSSSSSDFARPPNSQFSTRLFRLSIRNPLFSTTRAHHTTPQEQSSHTITHPQIHQANSLTLRLIQLHRCLRLEPALLRLALGMWLLLRRRGWDVLSLLRFVCV